MITGGIALFADIHSHILPALDDGADNTDTALKMLKMAEMLGTEHIIATTHYVSGSMENDAATIERKTRELREAAAEAGLSISIYPGVEVFLSPDIPELIDKEIIHTLNGSSFVLVELPMDIIPVYTDDVMFRMQLKGLTPIIAHPERNAAIRRNPGILESLCDRGILAQANSGSITGLYGREVRSAVLKLIRKGMIRFVASDAHSVGGRSSANLKKAEALVRRKFGSETAYKLFFGNGMAVIENRAEAIE